MITSDEALRLFGYPEFDQKFIDLWFSFSALAGAHPLAVDERHTSSEMIGLVSLGKCITFAEPTPSAPIFVTLDSSISSWISPTGLLRYGAAPCWLANRSNQTVTLVPSTGDIDDGTGATTSKTLDPGNSCLLIFQTNYAPGAVTLPEDGPHWLMLARGAASSIPTDGGIQFAVKGNGSVPSTGFKHRLIMPFSGTIQGWTIVADVSGSATFTIKKSDYATFPLTASIVASAKPTLSSAQKASSSTLTGWSTSVSKGDIIECFLDTVATVTDLILQLQVVKTS